MKTAFNVLFVICLACSAHAYVDMYLRRLGPDAEADVLQFNIRTRTYDGPDWASTANWFTWRLAFNVDGQMWWSHYLQQPKAASLGNIRSDYYNLPYNVFNSQTLHEGCKAFEEGRISITNAYFFLSGKDGMMIDDIQFLFKDASGDTCLLAHIKASDV